MSEIKDYKMDQMEAEGSQGSRIPLRERRKQNRGTGIKAAFSENKSMLVLFCVIVAALAVILVSILVLKISALPVCLIVVIEAALAICLHDVPIWLHGLVVIVQLIGGILTGGLVFMMLCSVLYLLGMLTLRYIRD